MINRKRFRSTECEVKRGSRGDGNQRQNIKTVPLNRAGSGGQHTGFGLIDQLYLVLRVNWGQPVRFVGAAGPGLYSEPLIPARKEPRHA
jgi:hypothetical protein